ncbi:hypothetical protein BKAS_0604 [Bifidobacterium catenulatum subsp. kashiwanohense JCM 15439 = DSM 21854]|nr:hypothetical protein BKAS_0604 [Bifidobacterium catenulatum subsp. kashiwanohense JCM 15439 = DSM 21854]
MLREDLLVLNARVGHSILTFLQHDVREMKGFYSEYWAFNSLTPINAPTSTARAFNVVTIWSTRHAATTRKANAHSPTIMEW